MEGVVEGVMEPDGVMEEDAVDDEVMEGSRPEVKEGEGELDSVAAPEGEPVEAGVVVGVMFEHADADSKLTNPLVGPNRAEPPPVGELSQKLLL